MYERPNKAIMAFADYLDYKARIEIDSETDLRFGLCFINSDETPELWWATGGSHADTVTVCMYDGKDVVELGSYGQFGSFTYMPRCHMVLAVIPLLAAWPVLLKAKSKAAAIMVL